MRSRLSSARVVLSLPVIFTGLVSCGGGDTGGGETVPTSTARLECQVADSASGKAVADASVNYQAGSKEYTTQTNADGKCTLDLPAAEVAGVQYPAATVAKAGYEPQTILCIRLQGGQACEQDVKLVPLAANVSIPVGGDTVMHLGDDLFQGSVNSQFQKASDGIELSFRIADWADQVKAPGITKATVYLDAKGWQSNICDNQIALSEFNRWGGTLKHELTNVLVQNLNVLLAERRANVMFDTLTFDPSYLVTVTVNRFDGQLGDMVWLNAAWSIWDVKAKKMLAVKTSVIQEKAAAQGYAALVAAKSRAITALSREIAEDRFVDAWGITWQRQPGNHYFDIALSPLREATMEDLERYPWPAVADPRRFAGLRDQARTLQGAGYAVVALTGISPFEFGYMLRGMHQWFLDLAGDHDFDRHCTQPLPCAHVSLDAAEPALRVCSVLPVRHAELRLAAQPQHRPPSELLATGPPLPPQRRVLLAGARRHGHATVAICAAHRRAGPVVHDPQRATAA